MKPKISAPKQVPRLNSLLHRLQKNAGPEDDPYLDQLMLFLDDPPSDVRDRWKAGAEMCAAWGITCSGTSVYRLYCSYKIEWRARIALKMDDLSAETPETLGRKAELMVALRTCEMLGDLDAKPATLLGLARLNFRNKTLEFARQKHYEGQLGDTERAFATLTKRCFGSDEAHFALDQLRKVISSNVNRRAIYNSANIPPELKTLLQP